MTGGSPFRQVLRSAQSRRPLLTAAAVALVLTAYFPAARGEFFSDDFVYVVGNVDLQSIRLAEFWQVFVQRTNPYEYLPLRDLSYRIDLALFGFKPTGYHLHNFLLYALSCLAVWLSCSAMFALVKPYDSRHSPAELSERGWICAAATILFAVHPAHVESVAWISGRKDLLSGLFALLSLWQFAKAITPDRPVWRHIWASAALFVLALMSKSTVLPLAAVAALLMLVKLQATGWHARGVTPIRLGIALLPLALLAAAWFALTVAVGGATGIKADPFTTAVARQNALPLLSVQILGYLTKIALFPTSLRLIYDVGQPGPQALAAAGAGGIMLVAGIAGGFAAWFRGSLFGLGAFLFVAFSLPFLQLVPFSTWSLASERFLFLPVLGPALSVAALLAHKSSVVRVPTATLLALGGLILTANQAPKWADTERLMTDAARASPQNMTAQERYIGSVLLPARRYDDAMQAAAGVRDIVGQDALMRYVRLERALNSGDAAQAQSEAHMLALIAGPEFIGIGFQLVLGDLAEQRGDYFEAVRHYHQATRTSRRHEDLLRARRSLERARSRYADTLALLRNRAATYPDNVVVQGELANLEMELFMLDDAAARYRSILERHPNLPAAHYNLGLAYSRSGKWRDAIRELRSAIQLGISSATAWNNLAIALRRSGDIRGAEVAYGTALNLDADHCAAAINLGRLRLALERFGDAKTAFAQAQTERCEGGLRQLAALYLEQTDSLIAR